MRERPILFSAPMVRAILDGRKTQTRRVISPQPPSVDSVREKAGDSYHLADVGDPGLWRVRGPVWAVRELMAGEPVDARSRADVGPQWRCPFGKPCDRLWVKETWGLHAYGDETDWYRGSIRGLSGDEIQEGWMVAHRSDWGPAQEGCFWRPAIFMPRWASRITLEVTDVRVERLQSIRTTDAMAEGVDPAQNAAGVLSYTTGFHRLWNAINGDRASWSSNPWVWVISFRKVDR